MTGLVPFGETAPPPEGAGSVADVLMPSRDTAARRPSAGPDGLPLTALRAPAGPAITFRGGTVTTHGPPRKRSDHTDRQGSPGRDNHHR
jgi:hypothetical protein